MWSYTSTPPYVFMTWYLVKHEDNFTFYLAYFLSLEGKGADMWDHSAVSAPSKFFNQPINFHEIQYAV